MTDTMTMTRESGIDRVFGAVVNPQTYRNMLYLVVSFPLGIAYFVLLSVGISLGLGLLIVFIGLPILLLVFALTGALAGFERKLTRSLLGARFVSRAPFAPAPPQLIERLRVHLTNSATWRGLLYLLVRFPMGIVSFVIVMALMAPSLVLITAPLTYTMVTITIGNSPVQTFDEAVFFCSVGALLGLLGIHLINVWASLWRHVAELLL